MDPTTRDLLRHFLAALAYRTQKALRDAPESFARFQAGQGVRTPQDLLRHMTSVLGYARTFIIGGSYTAELLPDMQSEIARFHEMLEDLGTRLASGATFTGTTPQSILQGPFSDAMTHAGQLALLRRLAGSPVPPENFVKADIRAGNLSAEQASPASFGQRDGKWDPRGGVAGRD
ncbi:MAG TPA: hypothetical protein VF713_12730 [Thermoanaerobaculia bacterium]